MPLSVALFSFHGLQRMYTLPWVVNQSPESLAISRRKILPALKYWVESRSCEKDINCCPCRRCCLYHPGGVYSHPRVLSLHAVHCHHSVNQDRKSTRLNSSHI